MTTKKSIRFYNDHEVRGVWDEEDSKWWFSATDIVRAINDEEDYTKSRNYWKYLKGKMNLTCNTECTVGAMGDVKPSFFVEHILKF